ncbi:MAG: polysaccharide deacetylase family protein [Verrucomicrobia bacterium]|nr:polysaccharide deacetylase family protein [Verrucomicrobiota bacterium]
MSPSFFVVLLAASALLPRAAEAQYGGDSTPAPQIETATPHPAGPRITYNHVTVDGPYIALTFDDGPAKTTTPRLLDMLARRGIKVTFFVLGENAQENPEILKREVAEGHEIGNHSWSHPNLAKMSDEAVRSQLQRTQDTVFQIAGIKPRLMRPPYGSFTDRQRKWANEQFGFSIALWEVDPNDWKKPGASTIAHRILSETHPGYIILAHDIHAQTIDAMAETLDGLLAKGFKFVTVSELIAMDHPVAKPVPATAPSPTLVGAAKKHK